jgi:hypothetical protein
MIFSTDSAAYGYAKAAKPKVIIKEREQNIRLIRSKKVSPYSESLRKLTYIAPKARIKKTIWAIVSKSKLILYSPLKWRTNILTSRAFPVSGCMTEGVKKGTPFLLMRELLGGKA